LLNDAIWDVAERMDGLRGARAGLERLAAQELSGDLRVALRGIAEAIRLHQEDIVDRISALGREINRRRDMGEL
jgi:hypothetical protein